jgi:hypothetical protein
MKRDELITRLDMLESKIPLLLNEYTEPDQLLLAIVGEADVIEDAAVEAEDVRYVASRVDRILANAGLNEARN